MNCCGCQLKCDTRGIEGCRHDRHVEAVRVSPGFRGSRPRYDSVSGSRAVLSTFAKFFISGDYGVVVSLRQYLSTRP